MYLNNIIALISNERDVNLYEFAKIYHIDEISPFVELISHAF